MESKDLGAIPEEETKKARNQVVIQLGVGPLIVECSLRITARMKPDRWGRTAIISPQEIEAKKESSHDSSMQ